MFNVCPKCGIYDEKKAVIAARKVIVCPACRAEIPFIPRPLFILTGASGSGKSSVIRMLAGRFQEVVALDSDILWMEAFHDPETWGAYINAWLRVAKNISMSGRPVLLAGAGLGVPENLLACSELRYFSVVHILALVCEDSILRARLQARPAWRQCTAEPFLTDQLKFNRWFQTEGQQAELPIHLLNTSRERVAETAAVIETWVRAKL